MSDTPHEDATVNEVPDSDLDDTDDGFEDPLVAEPPHPINWNLLNADDAEVEWLELNRWVDWLRHAYGLPASVIPPAWHRDFADARQRLREWVAASGTKLDHDRPTRQTVWPGEEPADPIEDIPINDRDAEFVEFVMADVQARREAEDAFYRDLDPDTGEVS